tara:strand:- start:436 stop:888 length:453 start_codon:yes stop_codon:yes gene_type:complete
MTLNTINTSLPKDWVDTPLTQWLVRNNVRTVNNFTVYTGIGWETGARIVRGYHSDYKMSTRIRGKLLRLGMPKQIISAHQKAVAKLSRKPILQRVAETIVDNPIGLSYSRSADNDDIKAIVKAQAKTIDELKQLLKSVGSRLMHFDLENK